jgi:hypothetical protein
MDVALRTSAPATLESRHPFAPFPVPWAAKSSEQPQAFNLQKIAHLGSVTSLDEVRRVGSAVAQRNVSLEDYGVSMP